MRNSSVLTALSPQMRQGVLATTLDQPDRCLYLSELSDRLGTSPSSLQQELLSRVASGILGILVHRRARVCTWMTRRRRVRFVSAKSQFPFDLPSVRTTTSLGSAPRKLTVWGVSFRQNPTKEDLPNEAEAVFGEADRGSAENRPRSGSPVAELIRQVGITEQTLYRWKKQRGWRLTRSSSSNSSGTRTGD